MATTQFYESFLQYSDYLERYFITTSFSKLSFNRFKVTRKDAYENLKTIFTQDIDYDNFFNHFMFLFLYFNDKILSENNFYLKRDIEKVFLFLTRFQIR